MEIYLVLDNIRSAYNVGAILRTAEGFGAKRVYFSGVTPRYEDERLLPHLREKLNRQIEKTALGAEKMVEIYASDDIKTEIEKLKTDAGATVLGLENNLEDERLVKMGTKDFAELCPAIQIRKKPVILILGEEVKGISPALYETIDKFIEIPMKGRKESFNVSVATGVALYALTVA